MPLAWVDNVLLEDALEAVDPQFKGCCNFKVRIMEPKTTTTKSANVEKSEAFTYTLRHFAADFPKFSESFRTYCEGLEDSVLFDLEVSLEELIVNSFTYGSPEGPIRVEADIKNNEVVVTVSDNAPPFNLLREAPKPPVAPSESIEDRPVGGLGIHLVKNLNDRVEYAGSQNGNKVTLFKTNKSRS